MHVNLRSFVFIIGLVILLSFGVDDVCSADEKEGTPASNKSTTQTDIQGRKDKGKGKNVLTFGINARFRYEYYENFNAKYYGDEPKKGEVPDDFLLGRFRLGFDYKPVKFIHLALWLQDAEVWGAGFEDEDWYNGKFKRENNPTKDPLELYTTFLKIKVSPFVIKIGRQLMAYANKRIYGPGQWSNSGKWMWDAAKVTYKFKAGFVDAYYGKTILHDPDVFSLNHGHGFESFGLYGHFELPKKYFGLGFEPFAMTKVNSRDTYTGEDEQKGDLDSYYVGTRVFTKDYKGISGDFTYLKQFGDCASDEIDAFAYHFLLGYKFKKIGIKPRISVEYSFASGDSDPTDGVKETFDGAFGARAMTFGRMNLFHAKNLKDAQLNLEAKPIKWLSFKAEYHQFWLAEAKDAWYLNPKEYRDKTGSSGDKVGREFDIVAKLKILKGNQIQVGYGHFWPDEFTKEQASDLCADWFFIQVMQGFSLPLF